MELQIFFLFFILFSYVSSASAAVDSFGCERDCGNISVPYPFGWGDSKACYKDEYYKVICNDTSNSSTLFLGENIPLYNISVENATAVVGIDISFVCYSETGISESSFQNASLGTVFVFSTQNRLMAVGCDTVAVMSDSTLEGFSTGCVSMCPSKEKIEYSINFKEALLSCSGIGCCQTTVPENLDVMKVMISSFFNHSGQLETNPCSFAFLGDPTWYRDSANFALTDTPQSKTSSPVVLDWAIRGNITCQNKDSLICGENTNCFNSSTGSGYLCSCREGFKGNPYTQTGCEDINECAIPQEFPCRGHCKNLPGNYTCFCSFGMQGDGKFGCSLSNVVKIIVAAIIGPLIAGGIGFFLRNIWMWYEKKIQDKKHLENGRLLLKHLSVKNFSRAELEKSTNNYDAEGLLGEGGNGWVYRGSLGDNTEISVKKSKVMNQNQIQQVLNEADIVSKINHKNVVKLLGVCMETEVPMLVYEFVPNGTLSHHIRQKHSKILYSWPTCLRIATETSGALEYMHSLAHPPIIHRDIKSANVLLDKNYTAKVADFGASKLIRLDGTVEDTQGQGTMGYLDPEYLQTGELTTKSDVYGFGVVLMELLSKEKPISRGISGEMLSLVKVFTLAVEENELDQVLKFENVTAKQREEVETVAMLAVKCAAMSGKDRPTMKDVSYVLDGLCKEYQILKTEGTQEELVSLLVEEQFVTSTTHFHIDHSTRV